MIDTSLEKLLGLALLDLLRLAKELGLKSDWIKNQDPERFVLGQIAYMAIQYQSFPVKRTVNYISILTCCRFIPKSSRSSMKWIWDKKRIEYNFRQDIDPKYKKHGQQKSHSIKVDLHINF